MLLVVRAPTDRNTAKALIEAALTTVGYPEWRTLVDDEWEYTPTPMPDDLSAAQRALVEILALIDGAPIGAAAMPTAGWCRRRWLGIAPGGVLERAVAFVDGQRTSVPLWRALDILSIRGDKAASATLIANLGLTPVDRLELLTDLVFGAYRLDEDDYFPRDYWGCRAVQLEEIDASYADWAVRTVQRMTVLFSDDRLHRDRGNASRPSEELCWPMFTALVRGGVAIRPEWERCLFVGSDERYKELTRQFLMALEPSRRTQAFVSALERTATHAGVRTALAFLPEFPSAEVTQYVLDRCDRADRPKRTIIAELERLAPEHPAMQRPLNVFLGREPSRLDLSCKRVLEPVDGAELTRQQRAQLVEAGFRYDGQRQPWQARVSSAGASLVALKIVEIVDADGNPAFDALLYQGDSGTIFRAATSEVVAAIIQGTLECDDVALKEGLQAALDDT